MRERETFRELLVRIDERTTDTANDVALLKKVVLEGNGQPSMSVQIAKLSERSRGQGRQLAAIWGVILGILGVSNIH